MSEIVQVKAREIIDSRGQPTLEVDVFLRDGVRGRTAVPSGASTGAHEAVELRDGDPSRFFGKGVEKAVQNVNEVLAPELRGKDALNQIEIDQLLCQIDGTQNKSKLGANAILGVSLSTAKAASQFCKMGLYQYVGGILSYPLPVPLMNVLNGGAHANNGLDVQEFMIVPLGASSFKEAVRWGSQVFTSLKKILQEKGYSTAVGDEGGFAPKLESNKKALELLTQAIEKAGFKPGDEVALALDVAATELFSDGLYRWEGQKIKPQELIALYERYCTDFPIISIEDGLSEDSWGDWAELTRVLGDRCQLVGDDLFVTNAERLEMGIENEAATALLVKPNQIGTLSETVDAVRLAGRASMRTIMSHRSGETEDVTIADLAVGLGCQQIKTGSPCRGERTAKYNQLMRIEEELGGQSLYWGPAAF